MNENPDGTPNPLNPGLADSETKPMPDPVVAEDTTTESVTVSVEQAPIEPKDSVVEPKKKSGGKLGVILAVIFFLIAIACGVAAIIILKPFGGQDAVPAAISKLMSGAPKITVIDGTIKMTTEDMTMPMSDLTIGFQAGLDNVSSKNYVDANIKATLTDDDDFSFKAKEIHTNEGNLYLKLSGISSALQYLMLQNVINAVDDPTYVTDCAVDLETGDYNCSYAPEEDEELLDTILEPFDDSDDIDLQSGSLIGSLGLIDVIDGNWILITDTDFSNVSSLIDLDVPQCLISAAGNLGKYGKDFAKMYDENPFINYSTDNIAIAKKKDPLYKLSFDAEKMANFINAMGNSGFMNELNACMGYKATNAKVTAGDLEEILENVPEIYVEINGSDYFTRVYLEFSVSDDDCYTCESNGSGPEEVCKCVPKPATSVNVDMSFEYPESITIEEPTDYIDFNDVLSDVMEQFYGFSF